MKKGFKFGALTLSLVLMGAGLAGCKSEAPKVYKVNYEESTAYTISGVNEAGYKAGETVTFKVAATDKVNYEVNVVKYDETTVELVGDSYSFKMPSKNVTLSASVKTRIHFVYNEAFLRDGMTAEFVLCDGTDPMTGITLVPDTASLAHVTISGKFVTFELGYVGQVTLIAKEAGEEIFRETVSVQRHTKGTVESDPITAAEAKAIGQNLTPSTQSGSYPTEYYYYIQDVVSEITSAYDATYHNLGCYLGENKDFLAYRCEWYSQDDNPIVLGSYITYKCKIINYNNREVEDFTGDKDTEHKALAVDNTEVRLIRFNTDAKTVKLGTDYDAQVQTYPTTAPVPAGGISYTYSKAGVATCTAGVVHAEAVGDTNVVANLTVGQRSVTGKIHIYVQEGDVIGEDPDHPMSAKQAYDAGMKLAQNGVSDIFYYVEDTINSIKEAYDPLGYKNITCFIGDNGEFEIYKLKIEDTTAGSALEVGSLIKLGCKITRYYSTIENSYGTEEFISADSASVHRITVESDALFAGALYVKPEEKITIKSASYPASLKKDVTVEIGNTAVATYDAEKGEITGVVAGDTVVRLTSDTFVKEVALHVQAEAPKGSVDNPYSVLEVREFMKSEDFKDSVEYCVKGYVTYIHKNSTNDNLQIYLNETTTSDRDHQFYGYKIKNNLSPKPTVAVGGFVVLQGKLTIYNPQSKPDEKDWTFETNGSGTLISYVAPTAA